MAEQSADPGKCEGELRFWRWWCASAVEVGVQEADLPDLAFSEELLVDGVPVTGVFRVDLDPVSHWLRTSICIRADLCSRTTLRPVPPGTSSRSTTLPRMPAWVRAATDGLFALALQCASYEQLAWAFWRCREGAEAADRAGVKRARWLVRRWSSEAEPRYRPPGYSRGMQPIRFARREWIISDGWLVPTGSTGHG